MTTRRYLNPKLTGGKAKLMVVDHKYLVAPLNAPKSSVEDKENECAGTKSLGGIEKALLESNKLLKGVLHRVDKCEKQISSFESKLEESVSSTSVGSTPSRKKVQVPEEVRVRDWYMCNGFAGHTQCFFRGL